MMRRGAHRGRVALFTRVRADEVLTLYACDAVSVAIGGDGHVQTWTLPGEEASMNLELDGPDMRSTSALLHRLGIGRVSRVVCPQIDAEQAHAMRLHRAAMLSEVCVLHEPMRDAMARPARSLLPSTQRRRRKDDGRFNVLYADYMGAVTGDRRRRLFPLQDMADFLQDHATRTGALVFACTFAARFTLPLFAGRATAAQQILEDYLRPLWTWCGYRVRGDDGVHVRQYRRTASSMTMTFVCATLVYAPDEGARAQQEFPLTADGSAYDGYP